MPMEFKELIGKTWSRKAEIVVVTIIGIVLVARIGQLETKVTLCAMIVSGWIGTLGIIAQALIDYKHPKSNSNNAGEKTEQSPY